MAEVSGRISVKPYIGKDGTAKASLSMHCNSIKVHVGNTSGKTTEIKKVETATSPAENMATITEPIDDIPF